MTETQIQVWAQGGRVVLSIPMPGAREYRLRATPDVARQLALQLLDAARQA